MPYLDLYLRTKLAVLGRIVWSYDSSGVQARNYFGSMYEPIIVCVKDRKNYTFNSDGIAVEAKTGAKRKLIDYRKPVPAVYNSKKVPGNVWEIPRVRYRMPEYEEHPAQKPEALLERIIKAAAIQAIWLSIHFPAHSQPQQLPGGWQEERWVLRRRLPLSRLD